MSFFRNLIFSKSRTKWVLGGICSLTCFCAFSDGGVAIQATRIVYPEQSGQQTVSVLNSSTTDSFLIQSWVEDAAGRKSADLIVTPPLYLSEPGNENTLHIFHVNKNQRQDRETLYYFIAKAIPSTDEKKSDASEFKVATASRIKLFIRPDGLKPTSDEAPQSLSFSRDAGGVRISNPTPYYITLTGIKYGGTALKDVMVGPKESVLSSVKSANANTIYFQTINDSGAITKLLSRPIN